MSTLCPICCDEVEVQAFTECGHVTCAKCALIEHYLCHSDKCLLCQKEHVKMIIAPISAQIQSFRAFQAKNQLRMHPRFRVYYFQGASIYLELLENPPCPVCQQQYKNFQEMAIHLQEKHQEQYCRVCINNKPIFKIDQQRYANRDVQGHLSTHPTCKLCKQRMYDDQQLQDHYKTAHIRCDICRTFDIHDSFWTDEAALREHIEEAHYSCQFRQCVLECYGFASEEEQVEHMIEVHAGQIDAEPLNALRATLNALRRQRKVVDLAGIEDMRLRYSIDARDIAPARPRPTRQQQQSDEMFIQDYIAGVALKKEKRHKQHVDIENFVEYVEPETAPVYRGISKAEPERLLDFNVFDTPGVRFARNATIAAQSEDIFSGQGFKVVKQRKPKRDAQAERLSSAQTTQANNELLKDGAFAEFQERSEESNGITQYITPEAPAQREEQHTGPSAQEPAILVKKVKAKKGSSKAQQGRQEHAGGAEDVQEGDAEPEITFNSAVIEQARRRQQGAQIAARAPVVDYINYQTVQDAKDVTNNTVPESHVDGDLLVKKVKAKKAKKQQPSEPNVEDDDKEEPVLLFNIAAPKQQQQKEQGYITKPAKQTAMYINYQVSQAAKDVQNNTVPDSYVNGDIFAKVVKQKQKKQKKQEQRPIQDEEDDQEIITNIQISAQNIINSMKPQKQVQAPQKKAVQYIQYEQQNDAKDVQNNTVPDSHVDGQLQFKVVKERKNKKEHAQNTAIPEKDITNALALQQQSGENDTESQVADEIIVAKPKKSKQSSVPQAKQQDEEVEIPEFYFNKPKPVEKTVEKQSEAKLEDINKVFVYIVKVLHYMPARIYILRTHNNIVAAEEELSFNFGKDLLRQMNTIQLSIPQAQQMIVENNIRALPAQASFTLNDFYDYFKAKQAIQTIFFGSTQEIQSIHEMNQKIKTVLNNVVQRITTPQLYIFDGKEDKEILLKHFNIKEDKFLSIKVLESKTINSNNDIFEQLKQIAISD